MQKDNNYQLRILYPVKVLFKKRLIFFCLSENIKMFSESKKLEKFTVNRPVLKYTLKERKEGKLSLTETKKCKKEERWKEQIGTKIHCPKPD